MMRATFAVLTVILAFLIMNREALAQGADAVAVGDMVKIELPNSELAIEGVVSGIERDTLTVRHEDAWTLRIVERGDSVFVLRDDVLSEWTSLHAPDGYRLRVKKDRSRWPAVIGFTVGAAAGVGIGLATSEDDPGPGFHLTEESRVAFTTLFMSFVGGGLGYLLAGDSWAEARKPGDGLVIGRTNDGGFRLGLRVGVGR